MSVVLPAASGLAYDQTGGDVRRQAGKRGRTPAARQEKPWKRPEAGSQPAGKGSRLASSLRSVTVTGILPHDVVGIVGDDAETEDQIIPHF